MSTTAVRSPAEFEEQLQRYLYERSEEGRAVRVGEKEVSEQAAIVARYADLFSRDQLRALRDEEERADEDRREWLYRLRKTCESGLIAAELAEKDDELENEILAARVEFKGEELPLRSALARLAVISDYADRDELGERYRRRSADFNEQRLELLQFPFRGVRVVDQEVLVTLVGGREHAGHEFRGALQVQDVQTEPGERRGR